MNNELPLNVDLNGEVAVVTGAAGVLCSCLSKALAKAGAKVALLDLNGEKAEEVAKSIRDNGGEAKGYTCNVLDKDSLAAAHKEILKDFGPCSILLNGAGGNNPKATQDNEFSNGEEDLEGKYKSFFDLDKSGIEFVFNLNFLGTLLPTQEFTKDMLKGKKGKILNISSMNAFRPLTKIPAYSAAKSGISNFTQWLAVYFAKSGIRVNAIAPGFFVTNQNKDLLFKDGKPSARANKILNMTPMGRFGEAEELVGSTLFLLDDKAAGFITGVVLPIDGGFNAYSGV